MRMSETLIRQNNLNRLRQKNKNIEAEENEPTQSYREQKKEHWSLNTNSSVFSSVMEEGINTTESVFDRQAVFRTGEKSV
ncbi:MAG: hypothetical protein Q4C06_07595 [Bacillota bacterium]|nr:hypothetical protein [Bacillota bacterium]